jgi:hypothetical protein
LNTQTEAKFLEHEHFFIAILILEQFEKQKRENGTSTNFLSNFSISAGQRFFKYKDTTHAQIHSCLTKLVSSYLYIV